ncbi:membrane protein [Hymenobacter fastidiosus]|uniref:Membrane protein n=1 Tax=Hymenobacter fastidiosus TaxID=486264 RepID=A0ABP7T0K5_9BACT
MLKTKFAGLAGLVLLGLVSASRTQGQGLGNSPYSRVGFGDFVGNTGGVRQQGMGGIGLAAPNSTNVNELNPAMLAYVSRTTYEAGFNALFRRLHTVSQANRSGSASLGYLALAVPLSKSWGAAAGLKPYTSVDYESNTLSTVLNDPDKAQVLIQERGKGGLSEAYLSQGYRIGKGLSVGATVSYVFGSTDFSTGTAIVKSTDAAEDITKRIRIEQLHFSDFAFRGALHYRGKVTDKINYNLAGVYSLQTNLNGTRSRTQTRENVSGFELERLDEVIDEKGKAIVPALAQGGVSFDNNKNWSVNLDAAHQQWSKYRAFTGSAVAVDLKNTVRLGVGGEFTPDATSVDNYFKRITYRAGLNATQMPYQPNGQTLYDRSVSWGFGLPLPGATPLDATIISLAFTYGQRGNLDQYPLTEAGTTRTVSNVKDDYLKLQLGVTLNNRWFVKRRIE